MPLLATSGWASDGGDESQKEQGQEEQGQEAPRPEDSTRTELGVGVVWSEPTVFDITPNLPLDILVVVANQTTDWPGFCLVCKAWNKVTTARRVWTSRWNSRWNLVPLFDQDPDLGSTTFWSGAYKQIHLALLRCRHVAVGLPIRVDVGQGGRLQLFWFGFEAQAANLAVFSGSWIYEMTIPRNHRIAQVGWIVPTYNAGSSDDGVGDLDGGWGFDGERVYFWPGRPYPKPRREQGNAVLFGRSWRNAETLGVGIRVDQHGGTVAFEWFLDGQSVGTAPAILSPSADRAPFFPALSWQTHGFYCVPLQKYSDSRYMNPGPNLRFEYDGYKPLVSGQHKRFTEHVPSHPELAVVLRDDTAVDFGLIPKPECVSAGQ